MLSLVPEGLWFGGWGGGGIVKLLLNVHGNAKDGRLPMFSSHRNAQDVPDGRGFLSLGFWG